jgi:hypothetical protein
VPDTEIVKSLNRKLLWLIAAVAVLAVFSVAVIVGAVLVYRDAHRTHSALCAFHANLKGQVKDGHEFIKDHPHGFAGITPAVIASRIKAQESTLRALHGLNCPPGI